MYIQTEPSARQFPLHVSAPAHMKPADPVPVVADGGPHDALEQLPAPEGRAPGWKDHGGRPHAHAFFLASGKGSDSRGRCCCSCCEKPFDSPLADDLYVVHARWDNHLKRWIPICMHDHNFGSPPSYYQYGGFESMESASTWLFLALAILTLMLLVASTGTSAAAPGRGGGYYYQPDRTSADSSSRWVAVAVAALLLVLCTCTGCVLWWWVGDSDADADGLGRCDDGRV